MMKGKTRKKLSVDNFFLSLSIEVWSLAGKCKTQFKAALDWISSQSALIAQVSILNQPKSWSKKDKKNPNGDTLGPVKLADLLWSGLIVFHLYQVLVIPAQPG